MIITRRAFNAALTLTGIAAVAGLSPWRLIDLAQAQSVTAADVAKPVSLPDMALGPKDAAVTITEFASMTCPHCARFAEEVFPKIKAAYIDTNKVRYVFREFPLDRAAGAASLLTRCIAKDDAGKFFAVIDLLFKQQAEWAKPNALDPLKLIGKQAGMSGKAVEACIDDKAQTEKLIADQKYANEVLKVNSTPTFFINGEKVTGETSFEEFKKKIDPLLKS